MPATSPTRIDESIARGPQHTLGSRRVTPMLEQYFAAKSVHPDGILMFRMGDFFEMFFEDAVTAARVLDLVLTSRDKDKGAEAIPMAGVPHHAVASYIARLVEHGHTVVLCDQIEDPRKAKGLVRRAVTRIITPGTISDLEALDPASTSYLAAVSLDPGGLVVLALLDLLAGETLVTTCAPDTLSDELRRMGVRELLVPAVEREGIIRSVGDDVCAVRGLDEVRWPVGAAAQQALGERFSPFHIGEHQFQVG